MYLKSIEIHGFKSFANKITFQFHDGITGIVGPNGSGKSNVADAVRWVLGEQRIKQLRGASMQDVIFSGTEIRKPMGYAYVAITLDNRDHQLAIDFEEVTVARRIYRSGESEYLMNGSPVRLKDVNELFYDTGIGKEGYSIIGQGQIDKILSGKPEERRELFDEAAGIVKFKRRKSAAQKKLEDEKQNLLRVSDILSELEKQVEPLEKQSEKARIYLKKKEQLKDLDVNVFLLENARLKDQLAGVKEKYEIASGDLQETTSKYEHIKEEYEQVQAEIEQLDKQIEEERSQLTDTGMLRGKLEGEINVLKEQINSVRGNENHLLSRQENLQREIEARSRNEAAILEDKAEVDAHLSQLEEAREEAKAELARVQAQIDELNANIENGKNSIITALNERATIKSRMGRFDTMLEQIQIRRAELNSRLLRAKSDEAQQEDLIRKLEEEFLRINDNISAFNDRQSVLEEELNQIRDELSQKDQKLRDTQVVYHQDKSRLDALSNLTERYEGYGGSVKRVMERKSSNSGIIGVVADLIKVEKKYEVAIETALGGSIQNIVTETEETAKEMIAFLKQNKAGRATFLPLTSIRNRQEFRMKEVLAEPGVLGLADTLVNTEERYRDVATSLLGRIVVVDNVDNAVRIARKYKYSLRMVTLEGELFNPGGSISGGAYKNNSNLLGRRREMAELETKVRETLKSIDILLDDIEKTKQRRNKLRMELEQTKASLQEEFIHQNTARMNVAAAREKKEPTEQGYGDLQNEQREIASQIEEIQNGKEEIRRELEASELLEKDVDSRIHMAQKELEERKEEENLHSSRVSEWDLEVEKIRQKQGFEQTNLDRIRGDIQKFTEELKEIEEGMEAGRQEIARKEADILALQETINASYTNQNSGEEKLKADMERKEVLAGRQKNFFADRESLAERLSGLDKEVYRLSAQQEKLEESVEAQINYMWDEYEITLSDAAALKNEELQDLTAMKKEITSLKDQIRRLGDVNVNAIED